MTQDEIVELAIQGHASTRDAIRWAMNQEREACAEVCDDLYRVWTFTDEDDLNPPDALDCKRAIRARCQE
jgi:hypothetical protein